jgi:DNA (cytosine-5)-methyltransferase 1
MEKTVVELFAGVGGFRIGLNEVQLINDKVIEKDNFKFVWANQWEPSTNVQHAFDCYIKRFGESETHVNEDISVIDKKKIPNHTLLVGGFPCQDYSVARSLSKEKGIQGKKGVLWWQIRDILEVKRPPFVLLENVDRLLKSPSKQRGRDFGIMLRSFSDLGYAVEWRVINAAEYGRAQRRRRVFIFAYHQTTKFYKHISKQKASTVIENSGIFAKTFELEKSNHKLSESDISINKFKDLVDMTNKYNFAFHNSGFMIDNSIYTVNTIPVKKTPITLNEIIEKREIEDTYFIDDKVEKFRYLKGSKKIPRTNKETGIEYFYSEGGMTFPDPLDLPGRTMLTSEGSVNRSTHVIEDFKTKKYRLITPIEAERLNDFPDNWTNTGMPINRRYFMMGNALVTGIVKSLGQTIANIIDNE